MKEDFYVYLPSNNRFLDTNTTSHFTVKLDKEIYLNGIWECGLKEIIFPNSFYTISQKDAKFKVKVGKEAFRYVYFPYGFYSDAEQLIRELNNALRHHLLDYTVDPDGSRLSYNSISHKCEVIVSEGVQILFKSPLSRILGVNLDAFRVTSGFTSGQSMDMTGGIDALYIYSDVIQTKLVGDVSVPLLRVVPILSKSNLICHKEYTKPNYLPLAKQSFTTIEIYIMDSAGRKISFEFGKTTILLHFRRRK